MILNFSKMHGLGNDFLVVEQFSQRTRFTPTLIRALSNRHTGVGFDQLLIVDMPQCKDIDFSYQIFNADGSEVENCGNGVRCLARFVFEQKLTGKSHIRIATSNSTMELQLIRPDWIKVDMGKPILKLEDIPFNAQNSIAREQSNSFTVQVPDLGEVQLIVTSMGNPHATIIVEDIQQAPVAHWGAIIEQLACFPNKVNVGFMQIVSPTEINLRVFERGAGETQACGTGACAAVVAGRLAQQLDENVTVNLPGGSLEITWDTQQSVFMTGPAAQVYTGKINLKELQNS